MRGSILACGKRICALEHYLQFLAVPPFLHCQYLQWVQPGQAWLCTVSTVCLHSELHSGLFCWFFSVIIFSNIDSGCTIVPVAAALLPQHVKIKGFNHLLCWTCSSHWIMVWHTAFSQQSATCCSPLAVPWLLTRADGVCGLSWQIIMAFKRDRRN